MNYTDLSQAIQDFAENDESTFVSQIPLFVRQAEQKILRAVHLPVTRQEHQSATLFTSGAASIDISALSPPMLTPLSLRLTDATDTEAPYYLLFKDETFLRQAWPDDDGTPTGRPEVYAVGDSGTLLFKPTADANYDGTLKYIGMPDSITTASTSWLGTNAESALLYGSLVNAYVFMKGEQDIIQLYRDEFNNELALLAKEYGELETHEFRDSTVS